ncbi:hypothetical protein [Virgibacillus sp. DJP39]|uniref:hypothetical protein n=1 Tax=Virgibacillus sp. DJP39 TaxID=3409790 RepID=UPI003BB6A511
MSDVNKEVWLDSIENKRFKKGEENDLAKAFFIKPKHSNMIKKVIDEKQIKLNGIKNQVWIHKEFKMKPVIKYNMKNSDLLRKDEWYYVDRNRFFIGRPFKNEELKNIIYKEKRANGVFIVSALLFKLKGEF